MTADQSTSDPLSVIRLLGADTGGEQLRELLREVIDPELGVDIVSLGLVYNVQLHGRAVDVLLTTTTPACPLGSYLTDEVRRVLLDSGAVDYVQVELTHTPPWTPEMISESTRRQFGWN